MQTKKTKVESARGETFRIGPSVKIDPIYVAVHEWKQHLESHQVITDERKVKSYEQSTYNSSIRIAVVLKPRSTEELAMCVRIANKYSVSIYTVSKGRNWGLGSKTPVKNYSVLIELSALNTIRAYSEDYGYVVVEPGVTFQQCAEFLKFKKSKFFLNVIGGPSDASIIGNVLDRGDGIGPLSERFPYVLNYEVMLADGSIIKTGFGNFTNSEIANLFPHGVGPSLDGLFSQSSFGIVTKMTVWLSPKTDHFTMLFSNYDSDQQLSDLIDNLKPVYLSGTYRTPMYFWNDFKHLSNIRSYPWKEMGGETPLRRDVLAKFKKEYNFKKWNCMTSLYPLTKFGRQYQVKELTSFMKKAADSIHIVDQARFKVLKKINKLIPLKGFDFLVDFWENNPFLGTPYKKTVQSLWWRKKQQLVSGDPHQDRCGALWMCFVTPFSGKQLTKATKVIESMVLSHGLEPNIAFFLSNTGRYIRVFVVLIYDKDIEAEDKAARSCHTEVMDYILKQGFLCNRLDTQSMDYFKSLSSSTYKEYMVKLKNAFDPNFIMSEGRYEF